jgi:parallel beta-helix repeat protein
MKKFCFKKVVVVCIFLLIMLCASISSSSGFKQDVESLFLNDGNVLYVGGIGPGNYSSIQGAIDDASPGDTVFVFDDSSPYYEHVSINKMINLIGEDKNTTVIDGTTNGNGVNISTDNVTIVGFTINNCSNGAGICLYSNNCIINDNIISYNIAGILIGIETYYGSDSYEPIVILSYGYNTITNNLIIGNKGLGIGLTGENNTINGNIISQTQYGIMLMFAVANNLSNNFISENEYGIFIIASYSNVIYRNNISKNEKLGVLLFCTSSDKILENNFIKNEQNAYFGQPILTRVRIIKKYFDLPINKSVWDGNFWNRPRLLPYKVPGYISLLFGFDSEPPYKVNIFQYDWHPAKKPYDISSNENIYLEGGI